ncbi:hypothetical protein CYMTET_43599 [Cymbomonas tetramitiformis]|nr:hypothetical protein CYMTET_43599 [Cymbomonas tetramitiformis]
MWWIAVSLTLVLVRVHATLPDIAYEEKLMNTQFDEMDVDGDGCVSRIEFFQHNKFQKASDLRNEKLLEDSSVLDTFSKGSSKFGRGGVEEKDSQVPWNHEYTTRIQRLADARLVAGTAAELRDSEASSRPTLPMSKLFLNWRNQTFALKVVGTAGAASASDSAHKQRASVSSSIVRSGVPSELRSELFTGNQGNIKDEEEVEFVVEWADLSNSSRQREIQGDTQTVSGQPMIDDPGDEVFRVRQLLDCDDDYGCGYTILDGDTTCSTAGLIWGGYASLENNSPRTCCEYCRTTYPETTATDYWIDRDWCSCYQTCSSPFRCVSRLCEGTYGGLVVTLKLHGSPPNSFPSPPVSDFPPPAMPSPPPMPPAPPLQTCCNETIANISNPNAIYAAELLSQALSTESIQLIVLGSAVSLEQESLPSIARPLNITGQCEGAPCELSGQRVFRIFALESGVTVVLRALALRFGFSSSNGGALYLAPYSSALLYECIVESSTALSGGAIYCDSNSSLVLNACFLHGNKAQGTGGLNGGGAVYAVGSSFLAVSNGSLFSNNYALRNGGSIYLLKESVLEMHNTTVNSSYAEEENGGAVALYYSNARIAESRLTKNSAGSMGGALCCTTKCSVTLADSVVAENLSQDSGGGLAGLTTGVILSVGPATQVVNNTANNSRGGGIYVYNEGSVHVFGSVVQYNQAPYGGGIYGHENTVLLLDAGTMVADNQAKVGGGVKVSRKSSLMLEDGSLVQHNIADENGGGIAMHEADIRLEVADFSAIDHNIAG